MVRVLQTSNPRRCEELWRALMPDELVTDLWAVRSCFQRHFKRPPCFLYVENGATIVGLLPLSWIEEAGTFGYFPGETWMGRTWLEGNRILARDADVLSALLDACPTNTRLRYLLPPEDMPADSPGDAVPGAARFEIDEVGYLFSPERYGFDVERWFGEFSFKNAKRLRRAIGAIEAKGVGFRIDDPADVDLLVELNRGRFGASSYFHDPRFLDGFLDLMAWLRAQGMLRITTLTIDDEPAAVDVGSIYRGVYTLIAGGTRPDHPGVAKAINLHHLRTACAGRYVSVDFLCGDFSWKPLFHLEPRPLYRFDGHVAAALAADSDGNLASRAV